MPNTEARNWWRGALLQVAMALLIGLGSSWIGQRLQAAILQERLTSLQEALRDLKTSVLTLNAEARLSRLEAVQGTLCERVGKLEEK